MIYACSLPHSKQMGVGATSLSTLLAVPPQSIPTPPKNAVTQEAASSPPQVSMTIGSMAPLSVGSQLITSKAMRLGELRTRLGTLGKSVSFRCTLIDNTAFCYSLRKGRSKADRLNEILRELFLISIKYECVFEPHWISTHDNVGADALSRGDMPRFVEWVREHYGRGLRLSRVGEHGAHGGTRDTARESLEAIKPKHDFNCLE